jgi:hypothetical protein
MAPWSEPFPPITTKHQSLHAARFKGFLLPSSVINSSTGQSSDGATLHDNARYILGGECPHLIIEKSVIATINGLVVKTIADTCARLLHEQQHSFLVHRTRC